MFRTFAHALALSTALMAAPIVMGGSGLALAATPAAAKAEARKAKRVVRAQVRAMAKAKRKVRALEKRLARDTKRARKSKGAARRKLRARMAKTKAALRKARRTWRAETRTHNVAMRKVKRAERVLARGKARSRSLAKRETARERKARKARAEKLARTKKRALARRQARAARGVSHARSGWLGLQIFGRRPGGRASAYGARVDHGFSLPAVPTQALPKRYLRQQVRYATREKPGTVIVNTRSRYLYLVMAGGKAMRYGIGVGRAGFGWSGTANVGWKRAWPTWTPPAEMIEREPKLAKYGAASGGMPGGPANPLGARALYLMQNGRDTLYRLHGTPNWRSIGTAQSSGCIRLINQDVIDLYERVPNGAKVIVR